MLIQFVTLNSIAIVSNYKDHVFVFFKLVQLDSNFRMSLEYASREDVPYLSVSEDHYPRTSDFLVFCITFSLDIEHVTWCKRYKNSLN